MLATLAAFIAGSVARHRAHAVVGGARRRSNRLACRGARRMAALAMSLAGFAAIAIADDRARAPPTRRARRRRRTRRRDGCPSCSARAVAACRPARSDSPSSTSRRSLSPAVRGASPAPSRCGARKRRGSRHERRRVAVLVDAPAQTAALHAPRCHRRHLGDGRRHHSRRADRRGPRRAVRADLARAGAVARSRRSSAGCCSATARASPTAATSARTSAASRPAACTAGSGSSPPLSAASMGTRLRPLFGLRVERSRDHH